VLKTGGPTRCPDTSASHRTVRRRPGRPSQEASSDDRHRGSATIDVAEPRRRLRLQAQPRGAVHGPGRRDLARSRGPAGRSHRSGDDAAVWRQDDGRCLVATTDFFTPLVDDPADWGRIAATNAVSDVYAMGATPRFALNLVGWPRDLPFDVLREVLDGAAEVATAAGYPVAGGHSIDSVEPLFGQVVIGDVAEDAADQRRRAARRRARAHQGAGHRHRHHRAQALRAAAPGRRLAAGLRLPGGGRLDDPAQPRGRRGGRRSRCARRHRRHRLRPARPPPPAHPRQRGAAR
jgi:hypothetical protein